MFKIVFFVLLRILAKGGHEMFALSPLPEGIPMRQLEGVYFRIGELFDQLHHVFEEDHNNSFKGLLRQRDVLVVLDQVVHKSAVIQLVGQDLLVYDLEAVDVYVALGQQ